MITFVSQKYVVYKLQEIIKKRNLKKNWEKRNLKYFMYAGLSKNKIPNLKRLRITRMFERSSTKA